eukprot:443567-Amphidinium_carterae.1
MKSLTNWTEIQTMTTSSQESQPQRRRRLRWGLLRTSTKPSFNSHASNLDALATTVEPMEKTQPLSYYGLNYLDEMDLCLHMEGPLQQTCKRYSENNLILYCGAMPKGVVVSQ